VVEFVPDHAGSIPNDRVVRDFLEVYQTHALFYVKRYLSLKKELASETKGGDLSPWK
jgi:hypothetical protein